MEENLIHFISTGGTIDSFYDGSKDTVVPSEKSIIPEFIKNLKLYVDTDFSTICMKDSRQINGEDRQKILKTVEESRSNKIIITHGTYTMPDTARYLKANLKRNDQVIIITGSMIPITGFSPSDGPFNLGFAVAKLEDLENGVYVAMNGKIFNPEEVLKDLSEARFSSIFSKNN